MCWLVGHLCVWLFSETPRPALFVQPYFHHHSHVWLDILVFTILTISDITRRSTFFRGLTSWPGFGAWPAACLQGAISIWKPKTLDFARAEYHSATYSSFLLLNMNSSRGGHGMTAGSCLRLCKRGQHHQTFRIRSSALMVSLRRRHPDAGVEP